MIPQLHPPVPRRLRGFPVPVPILVLALSCFAVEPAGAQKSLIITMDDVSREHYPTLDGLDPVSFSSFYVHPMCATTRAALLTGRKPWRNRVGSKADLRREEVTIMEAVPPAFHAAIGKWGVDWRCRVSPLLQGHDLFSGTIRSPGDYWDYRKRLQFPWADLSLPPTDYSTREVTDEAITLLGLLGDEWCLQVHYYAAHAPHEPPPGYQDEGKFQNYLNMIEFMGLEIERLLGHVDLDETLVVLFSDNGSSFHDGRGKGTIYQPAINEALIVAGSVAGQPVIRGPRTDLVAVEDVFATILENHGLSSSAEDSISLGPTLVSGSAHPRTETISERFRPSSAPYDIHQRAAITTRFGDTFKLHLDCLNSSDPYQLFNLSQDPDETTPLQLSGPEFDFLVAHLKANHDCD